MAALEELGLTDVFDVVLGGSAGAVTASYFISKQARFGSTVFYDDLTNKDFINVKRFFVGASILDLDYLIYYVCHEKKPLNFEALQNARQKLVVVSSSALNRRPVYFTDFKDRSDLDRQLIASEKIPIITGVPTYYRGDILFDAAVYEALPVNAALAEKATHMLVLSSQPDGGQIELHWLDRYLVSFLTGFYDREIARAYRHRDRKTNILIESLRKIDESGLWSYPGEMVLRRALYALPIFSKKSANSISLGFDQKSLRDMAMSGYRAVIDIFVEDDIERNILYNKYPPHKEFMEAEMRKHYR